MHGIDVAYCYRRRTFRGLCELGTFVCLAKTDELTEMPFRRRVGPKNHIYIG